MDTKITKKNRNTYILAAASFVVILVAIYFLFVFHKAPKGIKKSDSGNQLQDLSQVDLKNKPYITLTPTPEGAELILSIENMSYFDKIEYELTYLADNPQVPGEKIQRGSTGSDVNTKDPKYKKDMLLGTASKGVKSPDRGITDGKLTLHLTKGDTEYQSDSQWYMVEIGSKPITVTDANNTVSLDVPATLGKTYWMVLADTISVPPTYDHDIKSTITPIWGTFSVAPKFSKNIEVKIKLQQDAAKPVIHAFNLQESKWSDPQTNYSASDKTVSTSTDTFQTFVVESTK
ncbi:MAG TPA: hypothetical protein VLE91_01965 [Candidatus Saccharimonadales bacterium]|nr:hypothetical protein [Candidatus Saccharimonadales bacterium]